MATQPAGHRGDCSSGSFKPQGNPLLVLFAYFSFLLKHPAPFSTSSESDYLRGV